MARHFSCCRFAGALACFLLAVGCGGGDKTVEVTGTVTHLGKPVPNLLVHFVPEKGLRSFGLTDRNGKFTLHQPTGQPGVLVGAHKVWAQLRPVSSKDGKELQDNIAVQQSDPEMVKILEKYGNVETTPLIVEIKSGRALDVALD